MKPQLTTEEKNDIIQRYRNEESVGTIAASYGRVRSTIYKIIGLHKEREGNLTRKTLLDEKTRKRILKMVRKDPSIKTKKIAKRLKSKASVVTINRVLNENGIFSSGRKNPLRLVEVK